MKPTSVEPQSPSSYGKVPFVMSGPPNSTNTGNIHKNSYKKILEIFRKIWIIYWITLAGEPICFGDSGGPLYKSLGKGKGHVLLGVFSYILWGLCGGPRDLAYYVNVEHNIDWIFQYVPKNSTCR